MGKSQPEPRFSNAKKTIRTLWVTWTILFVTAVYLVSDHFELIPGLNGVDASELLLAAFLMLLTFGLNLFVATHQSVEALGERNKTLDSRLNNTLDSVKEHVGESNTDRPSLDKRFSDLKDSLDKLNDDVRRIADKHARIIFPHANEPKRHIVGVDHYQGPLPPSRPPPSARSKWNITYSVLNYRWLQDLLFNHRYLEHVVRSKDASSEEHKLLIIDGAIRHNGQAPHHDVAVKGYISLTAALGIKTYLVTESEYDGFLETVPLVFDDDTLAAAVQRLMHGHPELSYNGYLGAAVVKPNETDNPRMLLLRHSANPVAKHCDESKAEIAALSLFLEDFVATGGKDGYGRLCEGDGEDALTKATSGKEIWRIDAAHVNWLKSKWAKRARDLGLQATQS